MEREKGNPKARFQRSSTKRRRKGPCRKGIGREFGCTEDGKKKSSESSISDRVTTGTGQEKSD